MKQKNFETLFFSGGVANFVCFKFFFSTKTVNKIKL